MPHIHGTAVARLQSAERSGGTGRVEDELIAWLQAVDSEALLAVRAKHALEEGKLRGGALATHAMRCKHASAAEGGARKALTPVAGRKAHLRTPVTSFSFIFLTIFCVIASVPRSSTGAADGM
jgi:hypothetical protein